MAQDEKKKKAKSLKNSFWDGFFTSGMTGLTQEYFTPFLLVLGGTSRHVAMLTALPNLLSALVQLKTADIAEFIRSRKMLITSLVYLQALVLLPMIAIAVYNKVEPKVFIGLVVFFTAFGAMAAPPWGSMMSDLVDQRKRGEYFGWRNKVLGFVAISSSLGAGTILTVAKKGNVFAGFMVLFITAFVFRMLSWYFLERMYDPPMPYTKEDRFTFIDFLRRAKDSNFAKFVIFVAIMNFTVNMASPFFSVLMLRDLGFNYMTYTIVVVSAPLTVYLMIRRWGMHADKVGNLKVLRVTAPLIGFIPLLWVFNRKPLFLIMAQIFSGFAWAGFNIAASNFIYDAVKPEKRIRCISYFNTFNGTALCLGALTGGFLLVKLPPLFGYKILTLLVISSIFRIFVAFTVPPVLKEVRPVHEVKNFKLFSSVIGIKPLFGSDRSTDATTK